MPQPLVCVWDTTRGRRICAAILERFRPIKPPQATRESEHRKTQLPQ